MTDKKLDKVYRKYHNTVNMTYSELIRWSQDPCSKQASIDRSPISRNVILLGTPKQDWTHKHINWANRTISFIKRMKKVKAGKPVSRDCQLSRRTIALRNWAYNP